MQQCAHCQGFLPQKSKSESAPCPHCGELSIVSPNAKGSQNGRVFTNLSWKQRLTAAAGTGAMMFTLMACYGMSPHQPNACEKVDNDKDGYYACKSGSVGTLGTDEDCNDNDPKIHPKAKDISKDNVDQNCNGKDGE